MVLRVLRVLRVLSAIRWQGRGILPAVATFAHCMCYVCCALYTSRANRFFATETSTWHECG
jgi:hypothetical protein